MTKRRTQPSEQHRRLVRLVLACAFPGAKPDQDTVQAVAARLAAKIGVIDVAYVQALRLRSGSTYRVVARMGHHRGQLRSRAIKEIISSWDASPRGAEFARDEIERSTFPAVFVLSAPKGSGR